MEADKKPNLLTGCCKLYHAVQLYVARYVTRLYRKLIISKPIKFLCGAISSITAPMWPWIVKEMNTM